MSLQAQLKPIDIKRASKIIAERLRERILYGDLQNHTRLAPEQELAEQLGISRHHLREALRLLEQDGLVEIKRGYTGGVFLTVPRADVLSRSVEGILARNGVLLSDVLDAGRSLLMQCARLAATAATDEELREFDAQIKAEEKSPDVHRGLVDFRLTMARISHNQTLQLLMLSIDPLLTHAERSVVVPFSQNYARGLRGVVSALLARDGDLAANRIDRYNRGADAQLRRLGFDPATHTITDSMTPHEGPQGRR